jgi:hypothetical protein
MGEVVELVDVNGNKVVVALHPTLEALAVALGEHLPLATSLKDGRWLRITIVDKLS